MWLFKKWRREYLEEKRHELNMRCGALDFYLSEHIDDLAQLRLNYYDKQVDKIQIKLDKLNKKHQ